MDKSVSGKKLFDYLESKFTKTGEHYWINDKLHLSNTNNVTSVKAEVDIYVGTAEIRKRMVEWIDFCLVARENNEDIYDLAPYLEEYKNEIR